MPIIGVCLDRRAYTSMKNKTYEDISVDILIKIADKKNSSFDEILFKR